MHRELPLVSPRSRLPPYDFQAARWETFDTTRKTLPSASTTAVFENFKRATGYTNCEDELPSTCVAVLVSSIFLSCIMYDVNCHNVV